MKVKDKIFEKYWEGERDFFMFSDLPSDIQPYDIIEFERDEGYYSENNSWDPHTILRVYRERDETDLERMDRLTIAAVQSEKSKKARKEQYERLKLEFENETND